MCMVVPVHWCCWHTNDRESLFSSSSIISPYDASGRCTYCAIACATLCVGRPQVPVNISPLSIATGLASINQVSYVTPSVMSCSCDHKHNPAQNPAQSACREFETCTSEWQICYWSRCRCVMHFRCILKQTNEHSSGFQCLLSSGIVQSYLSGCSSDLFVHQHGIYTIPHVFNGCHIASYDWQCQTPFTITCARSPVSPAIDIIKHALLLTISS
jgi:hypothetical protein